MAENKNTVEQKKPEEQLYEAVKNVSESEKWRLLGIAQGLQLTKSTPEAG